MLWFDFLLGEFNNYIVLNYLIDFTFYIKYVQTFRNIFRFITNLLYFIKIEKQTSIDCGFVLSYVLFTITSHYTYIIFF